MRVPPTSGFELGGEAAAAANKDDNFTSTRAAVSLTRKQRRLVQTQLLCLHVVMLSDEFNEQYM
jgi:hypothetical protein